MWCSAIGRIVTLILSLLAAPLAVEAQLVEHGKHDAPAITTPREVFLAERRRILKREDFDVRETFQGSLDGAAQHVTVIFERHPWTAALLEVYELHPTPEGGIRVEKLGEIEEHHLAFEPLNGQDVNGDGLKELVVGSSRGGTINCIECHAIRIFQVQHGQLKELAIGGDRFFPRRLEDLDGDGHFEVITVDAKAYSELFVFANLCGPCPQAEVIYTWQNGQYVEASRQFPKIYEARIAKNEADLAEAEQQVLSCRNDLECWEAERWRTDAAVSLLLNFIHKGEAHRGWKRFQELIDPSRFKDPNEAERSQEMGDVLKALYGF